jgi:hypothetical protein
MLITKHFLVLQLPRTGGELLRDACLESLPATDLIPNDLHIGMPYDELVDDFGDLPMLSIVRNPWSWYRSWYRHMTEVHPDHRSGPVWESAFERGRSDFGTVVTRACTGEGFVSPRTSRVMREHDCDHLTALHLRAVGSGLDDGRVEIAKFETLAEDFLDFGARHGVAGIGEIAAALRDRLDEENGKRPYRDLYDDDLRELVGRRARLLADRYGYEF